MEEFVKLYYLFLYRGYTQFLCGIYKSPSSGKQQNLTPDKNPDSSNSINKKVLLLITWIRNYL